MKKNIKDTIRNILKRFYFYGNRFFCPCCGGHFRKMRPYEGSFYIRGELINAYTKNALCPNCGSHMRYRFLLTFLKNNTNVLKERIKLLHFAPEIKTSEFLKRQKNIEYIAGDIDPSLYVDTMKIDITNINFPDNNFDAVIASHVLEHVKEDKKAISEIFRVTKAGGWAVLVVPIYKEPFEDVNLDYAGRERMYGIGGHVRLNSLEDFKLKLINAGFKVHIYSFDDIPGEYIDRTAVSLYTESDKRLFFCKK